MDLKLSNNSYTKLTSPINNIQTTFNVENGSVLPNLGINEYFYLDILDLVDGTYETVKVTEKVTNSITCARASGGTLAKNFSINSPCGLRINRAVIDNVVDYMENMVNPNGLFSNSITYGLIDTIAETINFGGDATEINVGSSTGTTNINHSLRIFGNLTVDGLTTIINSTTISIDDPIFTLGGDTSPLVNDGKDRGIEFRWHDEFDPKVGFFGFQNSSHKFVFIPSATNNSEVFSGTLGIIQARTFESVVPTGEAPFSVESTTVVSNLNADLLDGYNASYFQSALSNLNNIQISSNLVGNRESSINLHGDDTYPNYSLRIGRTSTGVSEIIHRGTQDFLITTSEQSKIIFNTDQLVISSTGKVGINTDSPSYNLEVNGSFAAKTKSFQIDHPTKENYKLQYGSLESPYHGIRLTGKAVTSKNGLIVNLPSYINKLVKESGINIQLTPIGFINTLWVESIDLENNNFKVGSNLDGSYFFWSFTAIRKDVDDLIVELENN
jgi:hypothetical protein